MSIMPARAPRIAGATLFLLLLSPPLVAQGAAAARDSAALEQQAKLIARLDSEVAALRREVDGRAADSVRTQGAPASPSNGPSGLTGIRAGGLIQVWYAQGDGGYQNTFRIRRAELKLSGDAGSRARWGITLDAARSRGLLLTNLQTVW